MVFELVDGEFAVAAQGDTDNFTRLFVEHFGEFFRLVMADGQQVVVGQHLECVGGVGEGEFVIAFLFKLNFDLLVERIDPIHDAEAPGFVIAEHSFFHGAQVAQAQKCLFNGRGFFKGGGDELLLFAAGTEDVQQLFLGDGRGGALFESGPLVGRHGAIKLLLVDQAVFKKFGPFERADFFAVGGERIKFFDQFIDRYGLRFEVGEQLFFS